MVKENKLYNAVKSNNISIVIRVLEKYNKQNFNSKSSKKSIKPDWNFRDNHGLTVTHHAARNGNFEILEAILINGGKVDIFDLHGLRPISYACAEGHLKIVEFLLRWGSSVNRLNGFEYLTPLHLAAMYGYGEIAHLLLHHKADPFAVNRENKTALDLACAYGKYNVVNLLFSFTSNIINKDKKNNCNVSNNECGSRTPRIDHISRYNRFNQSTNPNTPKSNHCNLSSYTNSINNCSSANNQNSDKSKSRLIRNMAFGDSYCNFPLLQNVSRHPVSNMIHSNNLQKNLDPNLESKSKHILDDACDCPNLNDRSGSNSSNDLRQNLREACFAVQAKAVIPYNSKSDNHKGISFEIGELITVLKQYHNGLVKGFVTSEGISNTCIFPVNFIDYINDHKPPTCCSQALDKTFFQSLEQSVLESPAQYAKERPSYLELDASKRRQNFPNEIDDKHEENGGSPILIPPQMSDIRTNATNCTINWCQSAMPCCSCDNHLEPLCDRRDLSFHTPDSPSLSTSDLIHSSINKRNSIASMDSGRGSTTDSKSVFSGSTPSSANYNKSSISPVYQCPMKFNCHLNNVLCHCRKCSVLPGVTQTPFQHNHHANSNQDFHNLNKNLGAQKLSIYYPCSMVSLDETQYSSSGSDFGTDDIMINWLQFTGLANYTDALLAAGYDLTTLAKATPEDLNASGVTNPKDRQSMKIHLNRLSICDCLPDTMPASIHEFLDNLKLLQYEEILIKQNFSKIEHLLGLTWEDLADLGVEKLGHQKKLSLAIERLSRLANGSTNSASHTSPPPIDIIRNSSQKFQLSSVHQSRSFEELPYPTAIMNDLKTTEMEHHKICYQNVRPSNILNSNSFKTMSLLSKSNESIPNVTDIVPLPRPSQKIIFSGKHDNQSMSSSTSSCSQESSKDDSCLYQTQHKSSAAHFAHDNIGTVRIKRPIISTQIDTENM